MFNTLYIVRHGETDWNQKLKLQGWTDEPLNEVGISQAEKISNFFVDKEISGIYTSIMVRRSKLLSGDCRNLSGRIHPSRITSHPGFSP